MLWLNKNLPIVIVKLLRWKCYDLSTIISLLSPKLQGISYICTHCYCVLFRYIQKSWFVLDWYDWFSRIVQCCLIGILPVSLTFFARNWNSVKTSPCHSSVAAHQIAKIFCTCHDSTAVVPFTKFCCDRCIKIEVRVKEMSIKFELRWKNC